MKRMGPRTDPWGTPQVTVCGFDNVLHQVVDVFHQVVNVSLTCVIR